MSRVTMGLLFLAVFLCLVGGLWAVPMGAVQAELAVWGWLGESPQRLGEMLGVEVGGVESFTDDTGRVLYYAVRLVPAGLVVVSADDSVEPIVAFTSAGQLGEGLEEILKNDLAGRLNFAAEEISVNSQVADGSESATKWQRLMVLGTLEVVPMPSGGIASVSDVWVAPLVGSAWGQSSESGNLCYNYFTPNNWPSGCVATAMAQLMRYYEYPDYGIGSWEYTITVDGVDEQAWTRGGDGYGGVYDWANMTLDPDNSTGDTQRQAIGALCYDAAVSVEMDFTESVSGASSYVAKNELVSRFGYGSGVYGANGGGEIGVGLVDMINPNLDAGMPVMLSLERLGGGHAVLADGYGYDGGTLYHHLNMGWQGLDNVWYALPLVDATYYTYPVVDGCGYNIYMSGAGEIVSGRVVDMGGNPLAGVLVRAWDDGTLAGSAYSDSNGIYALAGLASDTAFIVNAEMTGHLFVAQEVTTGESTDWSEVAGNVWGVDFASVLATPPGAEGQDLNAISGDSLLITLTAIDEGEPDPPGALTYFVTQMPGHGWLFDPSYGEITSVPFELSGRVVEYLSCPYFIGADSFSFVADDGGVAPEGGLSDSAAVTVTLDDTIDYLHDVDTSYYSPGYPLDTQNYAMRTQSVYRADELPGVMVVTGLGLEFVTGPGQDLTDFTIRMQHTEQDEVVSASAFWMNEGWTEVCSENVLAAPLGWRWFELETPFIYDGVNNLMVDFSFNNSTAAASAIGVRISVKTATRSLFLLSETGTHGEPQGWELGDTGQIWGAGSVPNIKLTGTVWAEPLVGDFDDSCVVNLVDLATLAHTWLLSEGQTDYNSDCDISTLADAVINLADMEVFAEHWLEVY